MSPMGLAGDPAKLKELACLAYLRQNCQWLVNGCCVGVDTQTQRTHTCSDLVLQLYVSNPTATQPPHL
jgi:hypothetical protein